MSYHFVILYCLIVAIIFVLLFGVFKIYRLISKVRLMSRFLNGDIFSTELHRVIDNYFAHSDNIIKVAKNVMPFMTAHVIPNVLIKTIEKEADVDQKQENINVVSDVIETPLI